MSFWKKLFGGSEEDPAEEQRHQEAHDFDVLKYDGVAALHQHQYEYAIKCFQHALQLQDDLESHDYLSQALIAHNNLPEASEQLHVLAEAQPDNVQIWLRLADVAFMMEDYEAMTAACAKAQALEGDNPRVSYLSARACLGKGDQEKAVEWLTKAIADQDQKVKADGDRQQPYWDAYLLRGQTLLEMGQVEEAEKDADFLMSHVEGNEDIMLLKARCLKGRGDNEGAIAQYNKVVDANPFSVDAFRERAALRRSAGDEAGAGQDERMVKELSPKETTDDEDIEAQTEQAYRNVNPFG